MKSNAFLADVLLQCKSPDQDVARGKTNIGKIYSHACFHSSLVLLLRTAQNLAVDGCRNSALENLSYVRKCLLALEVCRELDVVAIQLDHVVAPIYHHLRRVANGSTGSVSSPTADGDGFVLDNIVSQLGSAITVSFMELWV